MALPDSLKLIDGTSYIVAFDTEWPASPTQGWSATVDAEMDLGGRATDTYHQSVKLDLGANRDPVYKVEMTVEMETDPTAGETIDIYVGWSDSATAGTGNPAGLVGTDSAYTGYGGAGAADTIKQLDFVGSLVLAAINDLDTAPQVGEVGVLLPKARYALFCVHNNTSVSYHATADEIAIRVTGLTHQVQD